MASVSLKLIDRLGNRYRFPVRSGQRLVDVLAEQGIPTHAVITHKRGQPICEHAVGYEDIDKVTVEMVRAYHLRQITHLPETGLNDPSAVYLKAILHFTPDGGGLKKFSSLDRYQFTDFVRQTFLDAVISRRLICPDDHLVVGFSGGRDSLGLVVLLNELKSDLPPFRMTAVTVNDCLDPLDLGYTRAISKRYGLAHRIVERKRIEEKFHLKFDLTETLQRIYDRIDRGRTIYVLHHIMRVLIEETAAELGAAKIALGQHKEDIAAGMMRSVTSGRPIGNAWSRSFAGFRYVYPLYALSKKEITLYLMLNEAPFAKQGQAATFDRGTVERDIHYAAIDTLSAVWPGFCENMFLGYASLRRRLVVAENFNQCSNCNGSFMGHPTLSACPVCVDLARVGALSAEGEKLVPGSDPEH